MTPFQHVHAFGAARSKICLLLAMARILARFALLYTMLTCDQYYVSCVVKLARRRARVNTAGCSQNWVARVLFVPSAKSLLRVDQEIWEGNYDWRDPHKYQELMSLLRFSFRFSLSTRFLCIFSAIFSYRSRSSFAARLSLMACTRLCSIM